MCCSLSGMAQLPALVVEVWREEEISLELDLAREHNMADEILERLDIKQ